MDVTTSRTSRTTNDRTLRRAMLSTPARAPPPPPPTLGGMASRGGAATAGARRVVRTMARTEARHRGSVPRPSSAMVRLGGGAARVGGRAPVVARGFGSGRSSRDAYDGEFEALARGDEMMDAKMNSAPGARVESDDLNSDLRDRTLQAIEKSNYRATVGDASAISGASVYDTQKALNALAADTGATLEVSNVGDLTYVFPKSTKAILSSKSFKMKVEPVMSGVKSLASYLFRVAFGTSLVASIMIVYTAIFALLSAQRSGDRDDRGRSYGGPRFYFYPSDLLWYWDPYYYRRPRRRDREMNFFESVFSFVFGDGDPNLDFEKRRWELVGRAIRKNKGVMTAEQLAPYLDTVGYEDESFVLPALTRFEGTPEVNSVSGTIIYRFPNMESTAGRVSAVGRGDSGALAQEERWAFSLAEPSQRFLAGLLGVANIVGVIILANMINDPKLMYHSREYVDLARSFAGLLPGLFTYGVLFFVVPILRVIRNMGKNQAIDARNNARLLAARRVANPEPRLAAKLAAASSASSQRVVGDAVYTSKEGGGDDFELSDFDRRLRERN